MAGMGQQYAVCVILAVVVQFVPPLLPAAGGITLDELPKLVESILEGQEELRSRVAVLQTLAVTTAAGIATSTLVPTPDRTATAQASATALKVHLFLIRYTSCFCRPLTNAMMVLVMLLMLFLSTIHGN